jgi:hypothetical protein
MLMENKSTPGPWKIRHSVFGRFEFYIETVDQSHDKTFIGNVGGGLQSKEEVESNAKLIAAAPDLLEILKDIAYGDGSDYRLHPSLTKRMNEVIKKATE